MKSLEKISRLLRIINLIQFRPGITAKELAEICETSERTIYRDLNILNMAGIPIVNSGKGKGYRFTTNFMQYPIDWNDDEYNAFRLLPILLPEQYQTTAFHSAYEKVMAAHAAEQVKRKKSISEISKIFHIGKSIGDAKFEDIFSLISEAVLSRRSIKAIYHTQSRNETTERKIDPYYIVPRNNRLYVIGYCHSKKDVRTFRLTRFLDVKILDETFTNEHVKLEKYFESTWSVIRGAKKIHFKVKFSKNVARYIKEEEYNVTPIMKELSDGSLLFEVTLNDDFEFIQWIMQYGPDAEILEPEEYRQRLKDTLKDWVKMYESSNH